MNKSNTILQITSEVLDRYRNSISRKAFIQAMERVIELVLGPGEHLPQAACPGLQLIRSPEMDSECLAQLLSGACPPFQQAKADFDCREFDCQTAAVLAGVRKAACKGGQPVSRSKAPPCSAR